MRRSSEKVPLASAMIQSPPPASTFPRRRSPSNEPPTTGTIVSAPCGVEPNSCQADVSRRRTMSGRNLIGSLTSEHLVNRVNRALRATVAAGHGNEAIQERVRLVRSHEARDGPEVVRRCVDTFAASDGRDHLGRTMAQAERAHRDQRAVIGPQGAAKIQFQHAVRAKEQPIRAAGWQNRTAKTRPLERAAAYRRGPARPVGHRADVLRRSDIYLHRHEKARVHSRLTKHPMSITTFASCILGRL